MDLNNLFYSFSFIKELSSKSKESQVKNRSKEAHESPSCEENGDII